MFKYLEAVKKLKSLLLNKKHMQTILFALAGAFLLAAAVAFFILWQEGEQAGKNARVLLASSGISPLTSDEVYDQPDVPEAKTTAEIKRMLETELKGYTVIARLDIQRLGLSLPVLSETSSKALKVSVCYYAGPEPGGKGNLVITGHNYGNGAHFGRLEELGIRDFVAVTDIKKNTYYYNIYKTEIIKPDDIKALQDTKYERELTLITCEKNGNRRLLVRCVQIDK